MMNIKRMPSCIAVVVAALLLAVSCGNMLEAPKAEGVEGGMGRLAVSMGDGRAVFPEELKFEEDKELTFTLSGSLDGGEDKEIRSWSAGGDKTAYQVMAADTSLTVEAGQWSFTLQAKRGGTVVATASKDLEVRGGTTNRLSFGTMAYSDEGTGTVTVTISWNEVEQVTSVVAGLYNASDDTMVSGTEVTFDTIEGAKVTYTKSDVPAGTYRLKAQMYQNTDVIGTYSELVRVAGGLSSEAERELESLNTLYTVRLDLGGQGELRTTFPETYNRSQTVTLPTAEQVASTTGAVFLHWYEEGDTEKKEVTEIAGMDGDKTYCAYWQVAPVTFTPDGGALDYEDTVTLSSQEGATIHYTVNDGEEKTGDSPVTVSVTGDTTITARATKDGLEPSTETTATYTLKRYTVTFNANGGTFADGEDTKTETVESGNTIEERSVTYPGYPVIKNELYRWEDEFGEAVTFPLKVEKNMTLTAEWGIKVGDTVYPKTSEVQVLSTAVDLSSLYVVDSEGNSVSQIFVENRVGSIQPFVMGQYEVTQQLYLAVMKEWGGTKKPSDTYGEGDEYPAYYVNWYDAVVFCNKLSELMGLEPVYSKGDQTDTSGWGEVPTSSTNDKWKDAITCDFTKSGYRLPTEAEWELAARGGNPEAEAWKDTYAGSSTIDGVAWYFGNSSGKTHQVGTKAPNSLELYDMTGNVSELCWDWWSDSITKDTPSGGATSESYRVYRWGSWSDESSKCMVSGRNYFRPSIRFSDQGFRLVRSAN